MMAIAAASFKEALRKRIILLTGILTIVYLAIFAALFYFAFSEMKEEGMSNALIMQSAVGFVSILGFYFSSLIVAFFTIMASIGSVSSELENGTIQSMITKPLKRSSYIVGKYLGLTYLVLACSTVLYSAIILISAMFDVPPLNHISAVTFVKGLVIFWLEPLTILALSLYGSVTFKTMNNGIMVIGIFILGMIGSMMEQIGASVGMDSLMKWGIFFSLVSPFQAVLSKMISLIYPVAGMSQLATGPLFISTRQPSSWMMLYILLYLVFFLLLAVRKFNRKDIA